ncbi:unnamed protein product [Closterium sp. NIES-65]|nr:unnamed protein product [Closterium sp. NIES-65]
MPRPAFNTAACRGDDAESREAVQIPAAPWPAIKEMKAALTFSGWDTWVQGAVCSTMTGITCDISGYVTRIKVPDFSGSLPAAIGDLIHLNYLSVHAPGMCLGLMTPSHTVPKSIAHRNV